MSPTNTIEVHFNKLEAIEAPIPNEVKVMVLLISLLDNYQNVITMMETFRPVDWMWDVMNTKLLNEKLTRKEKEKPIKAEKL
jgi:hypothetical protein